VVIDFLDYLWDEEVWGRSPTSDVAEPNSGSIRRRMVSRVICRTLELCNPGNPDKGQADPALQKVCYEFGRRHIKDILTVCLLDFGFKTDGPGCLQGLVSADDQIQALLTLKIGCYQVRIASSYFGMEV
jgi:hypothetical protein